MTKHRFKRDSPKRIKIEGNRYGSLLVIKYVGDLKYECLCDCGKTVNLKGQKLREKKRVSCGCIQHKIFVEYQGRIRDLGTVSRWTGIKYHTLYLRYIKGVRGMELLRKPCKGLPLKNKQGAPK